MDLNLEPRKQRRRYIRDLAVFGLMFGAILAGVVVYAWQLPSVYRSIGCLEWQAGSGTRHRSVDPEQRFRDELNDMTEVTSSGDLVAGVVERLTREERETFMRPFGGAVTNETEDRVIEDRIHADHRIHLDADAKKVRIEYLHPDSAMAARVAGLIMAELQGSLMRRRIDRELESVEDLKLRAEKQERRLNEVANALADYGEKLIVEQGGAYRTDATYMKLKERVLKEEVVLQPLIAEMRAITMGTFMEEVGWVSGARPTPANAMERLQVKMLFWAASWKKGVMLAVACGFLAVAGMRYRACVGER